MTDPLLIQRNQALDSLAKIASDITSGISAFEPADKQRILDACHLAARALNHPPVAYDETCNGWPNYETDMIAKEVTNDREERWPKRATVYAESPAKGGEWAVQTLADEMTASFADFACQISGLNSGLARAALGRVDWRGLAKHLLGEAAINPTPAARDWRTVTPLALGTRVLSIAGENDEGDEGKRETGPNATGEIIGNLRHENYEPYYSVEFQPSGVWVYLDQHELENPEAYRVLP